jgi:hypothetical protein
MNIMNTENTEEKPEEMKEWFMVYCKEPGKRVWVLLDFSDERDEAKTYCDEARSNPYRKGSEIKVLCFVAAHYLDLSPILRTLPADSIVY